MRDVPIRAAEPVSHHLLAGVEREFSTCFTLTDLLRWTAAQSPRVRVAEIVTQDEFTHDVVVPAGDAFLSFDTT